MSSITSKVCDTAEKITNDILEQQKIKVDAVSGATNSSKVIQQAITNALEKGAK